MSQQIQRLIESEVRVIAAFVELLRTEQDQLKAGETGNLAEIATSKEARVDELRKIATQRDAALATAGLAGDSAGLKQWAANGGPNAEEALGRLLDLAREARELNALNGQLVALRLAHTRAALAALSPDASDPGLYGSSGQKTSPTGYRLIDSA